jgi:hypothetical protein
VPSPVIATSLLALDQRHLVFGLRFCQKIVNSRFTSDRRSGKRVVPGDHHGTNAHGAKLFVQNG